MRKAVGRIAAALNYSRAKGIHVIYTRQVNLPEFLSSGLHGFLGREVSEWFPAKTYLCLKDTWDAEIVAEIRPVETDVVVEKNKPSAFYSTWTELWLRNRNIKTLILTGCTTGMCVAHTAMDAYARDYDVLVVEDGVGDQDPALHEAMLQLLDRRFGRVLPWDSVQKILDAYPNEAKISGHPASPGIKILSDPEKTYLRKVTIS
jgi:ureidoacrylate peracid hydrolase